LPKGPWSTAIKSFKKTSCAQYFATAEEAELAFYDALERADLTRLMQVWADNEEIVCVHPGGLRVVGLHAVKESWQEILAMVAWLSAPPLQPCCTA